MSKQYKRGKRIELELVKKLLRLGYAVMRAPASGARARRIFYPDIMAVKFDGKKHRVLIIEVKSRKEPETIYVEPHKVYAMKDYAARAGGEAYIVVRIGSEKTWYAVPIDALEKRGEKYAITKAVLERAKRLEEVF